jgi:uncharacterized protein (UPF0264 family)
MTCVDASGSAVAAVVGLDSIQIACYDPETDEKVPDFVEIVRALERVTREIRVTATGTGRRETVQLGRSFVISHHRGGRPLGWVICEPLA